MSLSIYVDGSEETSAFSDGVSMLMIGIPGVGLVGKYPVTQAQWFAVMKGNPSYYKGDDLPVDSISWHDCREFCERLSDMTGYKFRLPIFEEWETALGGQELSLETGWFYENSNRSAHPVGEKEPNKFGLCDMHGNVWEWCEDGKEGYCFLRGGSWSVRRLYARAVGRSVVSHPAVRGVVFGFRVMIEK